MATGTADCRFDKAALAVQVAIALLVLFFFAVSGPSRVTVYRGAVPGGDLSDGKTIVTSR